MVKRDFRIEISLFTVYRHIIILLLMVAAAEQLNTLDCSAVAINTRRSLIAWV